MSQTSSDWIDLKKPLENTLPFASRLSRLGTETAYAISGEAAALRASGKKIYPFHIGDLNFATPSIIKEHTIQALKENKTGYCPAAGIEPLREAIAQQVGKQRGIPYTKNEVLVQPGGKPVISKFILSVMEKGDEALFPTPGYPIYESLINFNEGVKKPYLYRETKDGFAIDIKEIEKMITPRTKLFFYNNYHNPTGAVSSDEEMQAIADLCIKHNLWVLSDEAYFDLVFGQKHGKSIAALPGMKERTLILLTCSKSWSMTGWRLGAAIGPEKLIAAMTKLATNDEACVTQFIQWGALPAFRGECNGFIDDLKVELKARRDVLVKKVNEIPGFSCTLPKSTFYLFVNVTEAMKMVGVSDIESFRQIILNRTGVSLCARFHFGKKLESETDDYLRFAYSGIEIPMIEEACEVLKQFMIEEAAARKGSKL